MHFWRFAFFLHVFIPSWERLPVCWFISVCRLLISVQWCVVICNSLVFMLFQTRSEYVFHLLDSASSTRFSIVRSGQHGHHGSRHLLWLWISWCGHPGIRLLTYPFRKNRWQSSFKGQSILWGLKRTSCNWFPNCEHGSTFEDGSFCCRYNLLWVYLTIPEFSWMMVIFCTLHFAANRIPFALRFISDNFEFAMEIRPQKGFRLLYQLSDCTWE